MPSEAYAASGRPSRVVGRHGWATGPAGQPARAASIEPMRRNASTVVVLAGPAPGEVLAALGRSMNVTLYRPERHRPERPADQEGDGLAAAAEALQRAGRASSPYALVPTD